MPPAPAPSTTTPVGLIGTASGLALSLSWRNPVGSGTPTSLLLDVSGSINTSIPLGVTEAFQYPNVPPGTYTFSVRAVTPAGVSAPSNAVTLSFPGNATSGGASSCTSAPQMPTNLTATKDGYAVMVQWHPPVGGSAAASYALHVTGAYVGSFSTVTPGLGGTVPPGSYTVSVQAVNACGASTMTPPITVTVP
jgi:predicted phage tail protein